jgi:hypothetical protein
MTQDNNIQRLTDLYLKVANNSATNMEKEELMRLLLENGSITEKQFNDFIMGRNAEKLLKMALFVAGIILLGRLLQKAIK